LHGPIPVPPGQPRLMVFCPPSTWPLGAALACGLLAMTSEALRLKLLGVGAMSSPRCAPAGLLVLHSAGNVMLDGGAGAEPEPPLAAWLVTDLRGRAHRSDPLACSHSGP
jgi:hypothetical protein